MKIIKHSLSAIALSALVAASAHAGTLSLYTTTNDSDGVTAHVYMDGKPVDGANIEMMTSGGTLKSQKMTDEHGRADFNFVGSMSSVMIKASTAGDEKSQWVKLDRSSNK